MEFQPERALIPCKDSDVPWNSSRRNGVLAREGIDTIVYTYAASFVLVTVEMEPQPEMALQNIKF